MFRFIPSTISVQDKIRRQVRRLEEDEEEMRSIIFKPEIRTAKDERASE